VPVPSAELGGAELAEFVAVGVGLLLGALGAGARVGAQLVPFAGRFGAQHLGFLGHGDQPLGVLGGGRVAIGSQELTWTGSRTERPAQCYVIRRG
jgi:hypothetical protein